MTDPLLQDPRLALTGAGFLGDTETEDGVHLRWSFDPDLGFPTTGFTLWIRRAGRPERGKVSFAELAAQLQTRTAPAGVTEGVTVHHADGEPIEPSGRCGQLGLDLSASPLVMRLLN